MIRLLLPWLILTTAPLRAGCDHFSHTLEMHQNLPGFMSQVVQSHPDPWDNFGKGLFDINRVRLLSQGIYRGTALYVLRYRVPGSEEQTIFTFEQATGAPFQLPANSEVRLDNGLTLLANIFGQYELLGSY